MGALVVGARPDSKRIDPVRCGLCTRPNYAYLGRKRFESGPQLGAGHIMLSNIHEPGQLNPSPQDLMISFIYALQSTGPPCTPNLSSVMRRHRIRRHFAALRGDFAETSRRLRGASRRFGVTNPRNRLVRCRGDASIVQKSYMRI